MDTTNKDNKADAHMITTVLDDQVDKPSAEDLENSVLCLIRHGTTKFNVEFQQMAQKYGLEGEEFKQMKIRKDLIDPPINDLGIAQCENGMKHINEIDFHTVFVSPMLRTCMTTTHMFKTHPKKESIKFVIVPIAKEGMHLCNDFSGPIAPVYEIFSDPSKCHGLNFDFSMYHSYGTEGSW